MRQTSISIIAHNASSTPPLFVSALNAALAYACRAVNKTSASSIVAYQNSANKQRHRARNARNVTASSVACAASAASWRCSRASTLHVCARQRVYHISALWRIAPYKPKQHNACCAHCARRACACRSHVLPCHCYCSCDKRRRIMRGENARIEISSGGGGGEKWQQQ